MSTAQRVIKNTGWLYAKMGVTMFISLYTTRLILNSLGAADFGIYNVVGGAIAMLGFINAAMASTTQRFLNYNEGAGDLERQKRIFNVSIVLHVSIAIIIGILLIVAGWIFFHGILNIPSERLFAAKVVYGCMIVSTLFTVISVPYDACLNAHENMRYYAVVGILESVLKLAVAFICVYTLCDKLIVYGILMAVIPLITLSIMYVYCHRHYQECVLALTKYYSRSIILDMSRFAGWSFLTTITSMLTQYGLGIVLNSFYGVVLNAAHGIANQVSGMLMAFSSNAQKAFNPVLVKSEGAGDRERLKYVTFFGCRISFYIFGIFSLPMIFLAPEILKIWLKDVPMWAVAFTQLQLLRTLLEQITLSMTMAILAEGNIKQYAIVRSVWYMLPLMIVPVLFYCNWSPLWMYFVWIFCWCIAGGWITIRCCKTNLGFQPSEYLLQVFIPCFIVTLISCCPYIINFCVSESTPTRLLITLLSEALFVVLGFMYIVDKDERVKIVSFVFNLRR